MQHSSYLMIAQFNCKSKHNSSYNGYNEGYSILPASKKVGKRSVDRPKLLVMTPGDMCPGQCHRQGTRMPPSCSDLRHQHRNSDFSENSPNVNIKYSNSIGIVM